MKSKMYFIALIFIGCNFLWNSVFAEENLYTISGKVRYEGNGDIYIYLVNEEMFLKPLVGLQTIILKTELANDTTLNRSFQFKAVKAGLYGIRCFQDTNGNGKLDRGLFGPKEPWGMSWNSEKPLKWPRFENIVFQVHSDISLKPIDVE